MDLPQDFLDRMQDLLGEQYPDFLTSYELDRTYGLRVNTLKIPVPDFLKLTTFQLEPVAWAPEGFYYQPEDEPGKHPYHDAGLYYIQEPSAMAVVTLLDPQPGERILDLAAAPGGKTTHIAARMQGRGLLVANEIDFGRAKILAQNVERLGVRNCIVCSERPDRLAGRFSSLFDRVLVDAPCSGEGMFRKEPAAIRQWSVEHVAGCATRQQSIIAEAAALVRPGGRLAYSTCTFAPLENEGVLESFLTAHPEFTLEEFTCYPGFDPGMPEWTAGHNPSLARAVRLWPHRARGEGHFIAILRKAEDSGQAASHQSRWTSLVGSELRLFQQFWREYVHLPTPEPVVRVGEFLYQLPDDCPDLTGMRILRSGLELGALRKNRFEPAHALALSLRPSEVQNDLSIPAQSREVRAYLAGETVPHSGRNGWCLVNVDGHSLGWGKLVGTTLKNHYPKGLRRR